MEQSIHLIKELADRLGYDLVYQLPVTFDNHAVFYLTRSIYPKGAKVGLPQFYIIDGGIRHLSVDETHEVLAGWDRKTKTLC